MPDVSEAGPAGSRASPFDRSAPDGDDLPVRVRRLLARLGLCDAADVREVVALEGGVASDIARVTLGRGLRLPDPRSRGGADRDGADGGARDGRPGPTVLCAKFALAKLRVAADWHAPVHRSAAETRWLEFAGRTVPGSAPALYGHDAELHGFAMEWLGDGRTWKAALLDGSSTGAEAAAVGDVLGRVHAASTAPGFDPAGFDNADDFRAIRIEPYLLHAARAHPDLAVRLHALADGLYVARAALVHGDVSPKNVLVRSAGTAPGGTVPGAPVLLDAECATMGDPAFDVAFCANHLVIKALHLPGARGALLDAAAALVAAHRAHVRHEDPDALDARVAELVPALMLARADGKSPVEYLDADGTDRLRALARPLVAGPPPSTRALLDALRDRLGGAS